MAESVNNFNHNNPYTVGVEEEYMICDPNTGTLISKADEIMNSLSNDMIDRYSYELILSEIEVNTPVCKNVAEAIDKIILLRNHTANLGKDLDYKIGISGTHPTAICKEQTFVNNDSYQWVANQLNYYAKRNITFATHVHIAVDNSECAIHAVNSLRRWIAPLLALSTNSPFFEGEKTGLKSSRTFQFGVFPRTNIPNTFKNFNDYSNILNKYLLAESIQKSRHIWWKIRPHINYGTIEFRICDMQRSLKRLEMIIALSQALVFQAVQDYKNESIIEEYNMEFLYDSLWKASRFPIDVKLIDPVSEEVSSLKEQIEIMINYVRAALKHFNTSHIIDTIYEICNGGSEADDQIKVFDKQGYLGLNKYLMENIDFN